MSKAQRNAPGLAWWSIATEAGRDFVVAAALHGKPLPVSWHAAFGVAARDVDALLKQGVLREAETGLELGGRADPALIMQQAPWSQRQRLHLTLAETCQRPPARLEAAAAHFEAAGRTADAARALLGAAESHCRRHRYAAAKRCFFAGLRLLPADTPDAEVVPALQGLAQCATLAAEVADAVTELRNWSHSSPWAERPVVRAEANLVLAALLAREERHVESARTRRAAARDLAALGRDAEAAAASLAAAGVLTYAAQFKLAQEAVDAAVNAAERLHDPALQAQSATWRGLILGMLGETAAGQRELQRALDLALRHQLTGEAAEIYRLLGTVQEYASLYPDEQSAFAGALKYCRKHGETYTAGLCLGCLSYSYLRSGNWKRSEETARRVFADRGIPAPSRYVAESVLGLLHAHRGETRPAQRLLQQSLTHCRRAGLLVMDFFNLHGLALVAEATGRTDEAAARHVELLEFWRSTDDRHDGIPGLSAAMEFFVEHDRRDDAAAAAEALDAIASHTTNPEAAGAAHAATAEMLALSGDTQRAIAEFRRAIAAFDQRELSIEPIRARLRLGAALQRGGRGDDARAWLNEARLRARRLGARPLLARADALLALPEIIVSAQLSSTAAPNAPVVVAAWELLSARQRDVARQLAHGLTNKEIAVQRGLSVRTVDMHVAHVLERLNCRTRTEAVARVAGALA